MAGQQIVSLHTARGVQLYQFLPDGQLSMKWTRELRETTILDLTVPSTVDYGRLPDISPWLHWCSVWDEHGESLLWTGPIQAVEASRDALQLSCADPSALAARTRCSVAKRWESADPADIAAELWGRIIDHHNLGCRPTVRPDPRGDRFDFKAAADEKMMDRVISDLVELGLYWSVVAGVPIFGPVSRTPVATLGEQHFVNGGLSVRRDGKQSANDVLVRAADTIAQARVPMGGLNLQSIVTLDDMFGVGNADKAVKQAVRYTGVIRESVAVPDGAVLTDDAPLTLEYCIPSARVVVDAFGLLSTMEIRRVTVTSAPDSGATVGLSLDSVNDDLPELLDNPRQTR